MNVTLRICPGLGVPISKSADSTTTAISSSQTAMAHRPMRPCAVLMTPPAHVRARRSRVASRRELHGGCGVRGDADTLESDTHH